ncbi:unnamed protein product [Ilex paraguariensis]|uniref:Homeobox domain-containing protein n=1 Tax=Ilex paraguariensis TaxID=185542 RepID=A0ABC8SQW5_9AQUA
MWMVGCDAEEFKISHSPNTRKLRPLMPRPTPNNTKRTTYSTKPTPYCDRIHSADIFAWNHHNVAATEQSQKAITTEPLVSSRWNPTPDQLQALEEMYRSGIRTPTADQIQQIAIKLRQFGNIQGKNVFYWFQNHKARERQKRRRTLEIFSEQQPHKIENLPRKESGFEVGQKNWATPSNCSTISEESESIHRAVVAKSRPDGWLKIEERELQQRSSSSSATTAAITASKNAMWQMTNSSSMSMSVSPTTKLIMKGITTTEQEDLGTTDPKLRSTQNLCLLEDLTMVEDGETRGFQTLQLFPMKSSDDCGVLKGDKNDSVEEPITATIAIGTHFKPNKFFEFL